MVSASRFRLLETGAALGAAAATDITCAGSGSRRRRLLRLGSCNQNLPALVDWEQSFFVGRARRGAARLRASCGCGSRSSLGAAPRVWRSLVEEAHTTLERLLLAVRACPMRPMRRALPGCPRADRCRQADRVLTGLARGDNVVLEEGAS